MQDLFALVANMFEEKFIGDLSEGASVQVRIDFAATAAGATCGSRPRHKGTAASSTYNA